MDARDSDELTDLVARARAGDMTARNELFRRSLPEVSRFIAYYVKDPHMREDVVGDVFIAVLENLRDLRDDSKFMSWMKQIARNKAVKPPPWWISLFSRSDEPAVFLEDLADPSQGTEERAMLLVLEDVLNNELPRHKRDAWILRRVEGHTYPECAEILGCGLATVKRWIVAADKIIRARVDLEEYPDD
jgi:RNA polymerase sigma-70 factor (ECF subfamily)